MKEKQGISLVALIITIIVLIILAATVIAVFKDGGIIDKAKEATFRNDITVFKEELLQYVLNKQVETLNAFDKTTLTKTTYNDIKEIIKSFTQKYENKVIIYRGEIAVDFTNLDEKEIEWAEALNLSELSSGISNGVIPSEAKSIKNYKIYGNSVQDGTPTPTTPVEVVSLGEEGTIEVVSRGKNLLDISNILNISTMNWNVQDGTVIGNNSNFTTIRFNIEKQFQAGETVNLNFNVKTSNSKYIVKLQNKLNFQSNLITITPSTVGIKSSSYTFTEDMEVVVEVYGISATAGILEINNIQLEEGAIATQYEPYQEPITTTIDLAGHESLRKIGNVADYIDYEKGKIVRNICSLNGTNLNWENLSQSTLKIFDADTIGMLRAKTTLNDTNSALCNRAKQGYSDTRTRDVNKFCMFVRTNGELLTRFAYSTDTTITLEQFKEKLLLWESEGKPLVFYYSLVTPIEESITLPRLPDNTREVQVISNENILPSNVEIEYYIEN